MHWLQLAIFVNDFSLYIPCYYCHRYKYIAFIIFDMYTHIYAYVRVAGWLVYQGPMFDSFYCRFSERFFFFMLSI